MSQRKALCIGIDDYSVKPLSGCVNDAKAWEELFSENYSVQTLHNEEATREGIVSALKDLISGSSRGQVLVVTYSGHGTQLDHGQDSGEDDGLDEALCPIDFNTTGDLLVDDDIGDLITDLPDGVSLTFLLDCCNSGTMTREIRPMLRSKAQGAKFNERFIQLDKELAERIGKNVRRRRKNRKTADRSLRDAMREVLISAALPDETAKETGGSGLFTQAAIEFLRNASGPVTHRDFTSAIRESVGQAIDELGTSSQTPSLYCDPQDRDRNLFSRKASAGAGNVGSGSTSGGSSAGASITNIFRGVESQAPSDALATFLESLAALIRSRGH